VFISLQNCQPEKVLISHSYVLYIRCIAE